MKVANSNEGGIPACNLLLLNDCEYGYKKGESFDIKFVNNLGYPLKYRTLIFEIKSDKFYKGVDYHLGLYKKNKTFVFYFVFFIMLPSLTITFLIPSIVHNKVKAAKGVQ